MAEGPRYSIITTCKDRLDHLKRTLPAMLSQADAEVIVVDFSCPQGTAAYVSTHFPTAKVVSVAGKDYFSNWEARNAGAAAAIGEWLVFCDADLVLAENCTSWLRENVESGCFGAFDVASKLKVHNKAGTTLGLNSLQGFQVIEREVFQSLRGYDERLRGYGAGGDTDLYHRAHVVLRRVKMLDESIVEELIEHDDQQRHKHTKVNWLLAYLRGCFYSRLKLTSLLLRGVLPAPQVADDMMSASSDAAQQLLKGRGSMDVAISIDKHELHLARSAGVKSATIETIVTVRIRMDGK